MPENKRLLLKEQIKGYNPACRAMTCNASLKLWGLKPSSVLAFVISKPVRGGRLAGWFSVVLSTLVTVSIERLKCAAT